MISQLSKMEQRFYEIENLLGQPHVAQDQNLFRKLSKERVELEEVVDLFQEYKKVTKDLEGAREIYRDSTGDMRDLAFEEVKELGGAKEDLERKLSLLLLPKDPNDARDVFLEVRAGAGGDEASLFSAELFRAYCKFCESKGWKVTLMSLSENELGGFKEVVALVQGKQVYSTLKYESGVHRVQRVPTTETQGRVHTSTVTVAILPEAEEVEVAVDENDLRIDTYRAGGAGGQHINRTDSAVRLTHIPTGLVVACQDERSQIKNKAKALKILQARLYEIAQMEKEKSFSQERKMQVGRGDRSERIRTFNFPQSRVTDHRINVTIHSIDAFMQGDMGDMIEQVREFYQSQMLQKQGESI